MTLEQTTMNTAEVFDALEAWIKQRSRLDPRNYGSSRTAYRQETRSISKDRKRAMAALAIARELQPAKPEILADSFRAFSGRLEWKLLTKQEIDAIKRDSGYTVTVKHTGHLSYTTGQYFPTEYRKAAASVLETYISGWKQWYATEHPRTYTYETMEDVIRANTEIGEHWFEPATMRFFKTRIESRLIAGHRFITSEKGPDEVRRYTIRDARPDGSIDTVGEFQGYRTLAQAKKDVLKEETK
jgi:hypothetical protein